LLSKLKSKESKSELEVDIYLSMSFWTSIHLLSLKSLKERILWRDLVRKLQFKKQLLMQELEKVHR
jgi:hypothetical protein